MSRSGDQVSINVFEIIDEICREFRKAWKSSQVTDIAKYVERVNESAQPILFRNLLNTELKLRFRKGESPTSSEYLKRFPQFAHIIRQEFDESTMGSFELADGTPEDSAGTAVVEPVSAVDSEADHTRTYDELAASRLGDYELIRELGRGGFGVVYEARHVKQQNRVALKTLPTGTDGQEVNADRLHKFRKEFRTLSEINHPNLVGMQTLEFDGTQWFFTMDLVKGTDFLSYVRPNDWLDEKHLRSSIKQLAAGIMALHDKGIVHRDLKPSNVLVEPNGRVVILDFGLVAQLQQNPDMTATRSAMFAGTPRYAAPEQMFGQRSEASDWYAMGVMLYEALTGAPPFPGRNPMEVLQQKQNEDPPTLSGRDDIPTDLATLADTLLRREPSHRATTSHIAQELKLDLESTKLPSAGSTDDDGVTLDPFPDEELELIGREEQLAQLEAAKQQLLATRKPVVCWITGLSGEGKSALAEKFLAPIRRGKEMLVLSGRCYDRESVPFKAIDSFIDSLVRFLRSNAGQKHRSNLPADTAFLARLFPLLNRVESVAETKIPEFASTEPEKTRARGLHAFRELLVKISIETPIVLFIDDLQWGDADSAKALSEIIADADKPSLLFLGSFRSDEVGDSSFLQHWNNQTSTNDDGELEQINIQVAPLSQEQCLELISIQTGKHSQITKQQAASMFEDSGGNPYFIEQLTAGIDEYTDKFLHCPLDQVISRRLEKLPRTATLLLHVVAVSGQPILVEEACRAADLESSDIATLTHMRSERLVRLLGDQNEILVETYHDKIRESVLDKLPEDAQKSLHLKIAGTIETNETYSAKDFLDFLRYDSATNAGDKPISGRVADLAHHFLMAGDSRAFVYKLLAAEQAIEGFAVEEAVGLYEEVLRLLPDDVPSILRYRVSLLAGRAFQWNMESDRAIEMYRIALEAAVDPIAKARACGGLANIYQQLGQMEKAVQQYDQAQMHLGINLPRSALGKLISFIEKSFRLSLIPRKWQVAKSIEKRNNYAVLQEIVGRSQSAYLEKDILRAIETSIYACLAGIRTGQPLLTAVGYSGAAMYYSALGFGLASNVFQRRAKQIDAQLNDPELQGVFLEQMAEASYYAGDLTPSDIQCREAIPLLRRCHDMEFLKRCLHINRHVHAYIGSTKDELANACNVLELSETTKNAQGLCWGAYDTAAAQARRGDLNNAVKMIQKSNKALYGERYNMTEAIRESSAAYVRLQCSDYVQARCLANAAWKIVVQSWVAIDPTMFCLPLLIESIAGPNWKSPISNDDTKFIKKMLRRATFLYLTNPNHQPHLQRAAGRAMMTMGKRSKAIRKFIKSIRLSKNKSMDYQRAKCLLDLAAVKEEGRDKNRAEAIELLKKMESVIPRAESWLLGDQYDEAVVAPEFDVEAWEKEHASTIQTNH